VDRKDLMEALLTEGKVNRAKSKPTPVNRWEPTKEGRGEKRKTKCRMYVTFGGGE